MDVGLSAVAGAEFPADREVQCVVKPLSLKFKLTHLSS